MYCNVFCRVPPSPPERVQGAAADLAPQLLRAIRTSALFLALERARGGVRGSLMVPAAKEGGWEELRGGVGDDGRGSKNAAAGGAACTACLQQGAAIPANKPAGREALSAAMEKGTGRGAGA
jgi:hypothetical protein